MPGIVLCRSALTLAWVLMELCHFVAGRAALQFVPYPGIVAAYGSRESKNQVQEQTG